MECVRTSKEAPHCDKNNLYEYYKNKEYKNRGSQSGQHNNELQYKHKVVPAPSITEIKERKDTIITRFFIKITNHRYQKVYKLRVEQQNTIHNIVSPNQGTMRTDIKEKENKNDKNIYTQIKLTVQNDNLKYHNTHATNNKYFATINNSNSHSFIQ